MTDRREAGDAAHHLAEQFGAGDPRAIVFFCSHHYDGAVLSAALRKHYPAAEVIGCTTAGEFTDRERGQGGVSALALGADRVRSCAASLARFEGGVNPGIRSATDQIAAKLGFDLRDADPRRYVGLVLVEGLRGREEAANHALGMAAPALAFVGGSAGDDLEFQRTRVFCNGEASDDGAALLVLEMEVPFAIVKTCSVAPTEHEFTITRADAANRVVYEVNGRPALDAYAEAVGVSPGELGLGVFMKHPWGMLLDGEPWIRSPKQVLPDGGLHFACAVEEDMALQVMRSTDLVGETRRAFAQVERELGQPIGGALIFNCTLRRLELDAADTHDSFLQIFSRFPMAGLHTYGESYLGHMNQTCTGLIFA